ncbi:hypothetical protein BGZ95_006175, partial [Linnemannia exigua]
MPQEQLPRQGHQAIRPVSKHYRHTSTSIDPPDITYLEIHTDPVSQKQVVFWEDILMIYKDALHVRCQSKVVPFLKGTDFQTLEPRRIAADPNVVLDVAIGERLVEVGAVSTKGIPPKSSLTFLKSRIDISGIIPGTDTRRNPSYGLEEAAMDKYRNNDNPAFRPAPRAPQLHTSERTTPSNAESQYSTTINRPRAPQLYTDAIPVTITATTSTEKFIQAMVNARLGDREAQFAVGDMYKEGRGVPTDLITAIDWYSKAANQGHVTDFNVQALWPISSTTSPDTAIAPNLNEVFYVDVHTDPDTKKGFVLWEDIKLAFDDALHVQHQGIRIPFLEGSDSIPLSPYRLPALLGEVLEVVVSDESVDTDNRLLLETNSNIDSGPPRRNPVYGLENTAMDNYSHIDNPNVLKNVYETTSQTGSQGVSIVNSISTNTATIGDTGKGRNPVYGLENTAMDNYSHIDNPALLPAPRAPQLYKDDETTDVAGVHRSVNTNQPRAPQKYMEAVIAPTVLEKYIQTMLDARLGDAASQVALGDMYKDGKGVQQDYQTAMDWYLMAAEQGNTDAYVSVGGLYLNGLCVQVDNVKAQSWYQKAADKGNADALEFLSGNFEDPHPNRIDGPRLVSIDDPHPNDIDNPHPVSIDDPHPNGIDNPHPV